MALLSPRLAAAGAAAPLILPQRRLFIARAPFIGRPREIEPWADPCRYRPRAAVAFDAKGSTFKFVSSPSSPQTFTNLTVGSGSNRALVATVIAARASGTMPTFSAHWDSTGTNQSMTLIQTFTSAPGGVVFWIALFGLVAPTSGNKTLNITWTGGNSPTDLWIDGVSFTGVDQTGGATTFYNTNSATGSSSPGSVTISSASGDAAVDALVNNGQLPSNTQTAIFANDNGAVSSAASSYGLGASIAFSHAWSPTSGAWLDAGVAIKAAGGGGSTIAYRRSLSQLGTRAGSRQRQAA